MKDWTKTRDDGYNQVYRRKVGDDTLTVWAYIDPDGGIGAEAFNYWWMIIRKVDDYTITSKRSFNSPEEAAKDVMEKLEKIKSLTSTE